jgi:hypothetical protein
MNDTLILVTPLLALLVLAVTFRFTGCSTFGSSPPEIKTVTGPPLVIEDPAIVPPPPPTAASYRDVVSAAPGFAAFWPLNETSPNIATVVGPLNPGANGVYTSGPGAVGAGYTLGNSGVLSHKDPSDFSPAFDVGYVQVPFNGQLNPPKTVAGFTIELWAKPNPNLGGATQVLISSHRFDSGTDQQGYEIALVKLPGQTVQQVRVQVFGNVGTPSQAIIPPLGGDAAEWRHIIMIYRLDAVVGGTITAYARVAKSTNGLKEGPHSGKYEAVISTSPSTLRFGAGHATGQGPTNLFVGQIDNVAFYNAVLDQNEIDKHFNMF